MKASFTIPLAIIIGGIIVAGAVYASIPKVEEGTSTSLIRLVDSSDHIFGNPSAKVVIVEYSDFDCAFCKTFHEILHQVIAHEGADGDVAWVFRQFPLTEIHPNALSHARAAECAGIVGGNDMFWKYADALFAAQPAKPSQYGTIASSIGISDNAFASCIADTPTEVEKSILADRQNALDIGAKGTPYSVILVAGKAPIVLKGASSYNAIKDLVDQALAK